MKKPRKPPPTLLPCPFCGAVVPRDPEFCSTERGPVLCCPDCGAQGPYSFKEEVCGSETEEQRREAGKAWNKRSAKK